MSENSRLRVANSGPRAFAPDFATNAAIGRVLTCVPNPDPTLPLDVDWQAAGGAVLRNLTRIFYVDPATSTPPASQIGNDEAPFATLAQAMALCVDPALNYEIWLTPVDYHLEALPPVTPNKLAIRNLSLMMGFYLDQPVLPAITYGATNLVFEGCAFHGAMGGVNVKFQTCEVDLDVTLTGALEAYDTFLGGPLDVLQINAQRCTVDGRVTCNGSGTLRQCEIGFVHHWTSAGGGVTHDVLYDDCHWKFASNVDTGGVADVLNCTVRNCRFNARTDFITSGTGFLNIDPISYSQQRAAGFVTGLTLQVPFGPNTARISVNVPAIVAAGVDYANVSTVGTTLEGITQDTPIIANPTADLAAAGAGNGGFINARVSALNTIRCTFVGILGAAPVDFEFTAAG